MGEGVAVHGRRYTHLRTEERETISLGLSQGLSLRMLARMVGRSPSTLSREYARNTIRGRPYYACTAHAQAATGACQPRCLCKLLDPSLW